MSTLNNSCDEANSRLKDFEMQDRYRIYIDERVRQLRDIYLLRC